MNVNVNVNVNVKEHTHTNDFFTKLKVITNVEPTHRPPIVHHLPSQTKNPNTPRVILSFPLCIHLFLSD